MVLALFLSTFVVFYCITNFLLEADLAWSTFKRISRADKLVVIFRDFEYILTLQKVSAGAGAGTQTESLGSKPGLYLLFKVLATASDVEVDLLEG